MPIFSPKIGENCDQNIDPRVTRLDKFSAIGGFLTLGSFSKITKVAHIFVLRFPSVKVMHYFFRKNGFGYISGDFFHKLVWSS
jgi:hypothetical protein